jgi:acyl carrier protein
MITENIRMVMGAVFGIDPKKISVEATPDNVEQWDSLRHMNLILALEDEFRVRFRDDQVQQLITFRLIELNLLELLSDKDDTGI